MEAAVASADKLIRDYDFFSDHLFLILLPKAYLLARLFGLSVWFLIGGFCAISILYIVSIFVWFYGLYCSLLLARIWKLHRLSVLRMWGFVSAIFIFSSAVGRGLRLLLVVRFF